MAAVWARFRAELRRKVAGTVLVSLFLGVAGGAVLGALAGARRTDTAYPRMRATTAAGDVLVSVDGTGLTGFYDELSRLPDVIAAGVGAGVDLVIIEGPPTIRSEDEPFPGLAAFDNRLLYEVGAPRVTDGRLPDPSRPDEAFGNRFLAKMGVRAGTRIGVQLAPTDGPFEPVGPIRQVTIVGLGTFTNEVVPVAVNDTFPTLYLTSAFYREWAGPRFAAFDGMFIRLRPGADTTRFRETAEDVLTRHPQAGEELFFLSEAQRTEVVQRAVAPQVIALQIFAALTALTAALLVGQTLSRQLYGDATDYPTMRALGMTRTQLFAVGMLRAGVVGLAGAVIAVVSAIAVSPMMPLGTARIAEPDPGVAVNVALLAAGAAAIVLALLLVMSLPAILRSRARVTSRPIDVAERGSRVAAALARTGAPTSMTVGVRMALDPGRGRTSAPVRSATVGTILAVTLLVATVTFGSSLDRLVDTPRLYGQNWDVTVDAGFGTIPAGPAAERLSSSPDVRGFSGAVVGDVVIAGRQVSAVAIDPVRGNVVPTFLEGRIPREPGEIALGARTLRAVGRRLGSTVPVELGAETRPMRIVGRAVFPQFGLGSFAPTGLGDGALLSASAMPPPEDGAGYNLFLVRLNHPADAGARERVFRAAVAGVPDCDAGFCSSSRDIRPGDVTNYARIRSTPLVLAGLLALLAATATGHALISSVRRRSRELAILRTVGFLRRQIAATVGWQATTLAVIALAVGIPAGVAAGRTAWNAFAGRLGFPPEPVVPLTIIGLAIPATLLIANATAALPGARAARLQPATVLRDE